MNAITAKFKSIPLFFVLLSFPFISFAQIQGSVVDVNNLPLPHANVLLLNQKDSSLVSGILATDEGTYNITSFKPGNYLLGVSMVGYKPAFSAPFVIKNSNEHKHNEPIVVEEDIHQLQDVNVVAKKPLYELQIDRMVVNVENSISSAGNSALEILEKSPGVVVDRQNNSISMGGKDGVIVMINGKQNRMPMEAAFQLLNSLSSDNVKKIELITTPPSKYDADGNAGIINVELRKNDTFGTNGSFKLGAGVATREKMDASFNINHHVEKVNLFGSYNTSFDNSRTRIDSYRRTNNQGSVQESDAISRREAITLFQNIRMGLDYTMSSKTVLSVLGTGYVRDWEADALNKIDYLENSAVTRRSNLNMQELSKWIHGMGNINLRHSIKEDEILDFNIDYLNYYNDNPSDYQVEKINNAGQLESGEDIKVTKITPINILVGKFDYIKQINPKFKLEGGLKSTFTFFENKVGVTYFNSGIGTIDKDLTNNYSLNEDISAIYSSFSYNITDKTGIVAGLRYEYMNSVLDSETEKGIVDLHYGELFPSFYFSHKLNKDNTFQLSYSRRIDRPTFNELAPFIVFMTPETFVSGNENLLPALSNIFKTEYQLKRIILSVTLTDTKNSIARFQPKYNDDQSKQYFISRNLDSDKTATGLLSFPLKITDWWDMQNNFNWIIKKIETNYDGTDISITQSNYRINTIQRINLSKRISAEIAGFYRSRALSGVYVQNPMGRMDIGLQMKFKNENSRLNLNLSDVFKSSVWKSYADVPELNIYTRWMLDFEPRVLRLSFTHNFGSTKIKSARDRKTGSEDERNRVGT